MNTRKLALIALCVFCPVSAYAAGPEIPKVDQVKPLGEDPLENLPGVFFYEDFEKIAGLSESFHDIGDSEGRFRINTKDPFSGGRSIMQTYLPMSEMTGDVGDAGWAWRFFGDNPLTTRIPEDQLQPYTTVVARWYHKFEEGFTPGPESNYPPKMARMRCFQFGQWNAAYSVLFWTEGADGHLSIERHTKAPGVHREWPPNHTADFKFSDPVNIGRWIHFELRVCLGDSARSDRIQAWADGVLVCDIANDDLAAGFRGFTLNAMSWDCYWNGGSPKKQSRFFDDVMLSTEPIGPVRTGLNPVIVKSAFSSQDSGAVQGAWEIEVAQGRQKELEVGYALDGIVTRYNPAEFDYTVVWRGSVTGVENEATVDNSLGGFTGPLAGGNGLAPNTLHFLRVRQKDSAGNWSEWSSWHSGFATTWANDATSEEKTLPEGYLVQARAAILEPDDIPPVIEGTNLGAVPDSLAPYRVTATVAEINLMDVYLYWRKQGDEEYSRVEMDQVNGGSFSAGIGEYSLGTVIEYYLRARDFQRNYTYAPAAYGSEPYRFTAGEVGGTCDFNGDSKVSITDVVALLIEGRRNPGNLAVDYNRDGTYSITDVISLLLDIITGKCP